MAVLESSFCIKATEETVKAFSEVRDSLFALETAQQGQQVLHAGAGVAHAAAEVEKWMASELMEVVMRAESAAMTQTLPPSIEIARLSREAERLRGLLTNAAGENRRFLATCEVLEAENAALRAELAASKDPIGASSVSKDPRSDALSRAITFDRPLDAYARR